MILHIPEDMGHDLEDCCVLQPQRFPHRYSCQPLKTLRTYYIMLVTLFKESIIICIKDKHMSIHTYCISHTSKKVLLTWSGGPEAAREGHQLSLLQRQSTRASRCPTRVPVAGQPGMPLVERSSIHPTRGPGCAHARARMWCG